MKYNALFLSLLLTANLVMSAEAKEKKVEVPQSNPMDWSLSMMEDHSGVKKTEPIWNMVQENKFGVFAFDSNSLSFVKSGKKWNKNEVEVTVKTVFSDKEIIKKLDEKYALKLQPREKTQYWLLHMRFNLVDNTYAIKKTEYFGSKETLLETINRKVNMVAIPEKSFADVMCQVCKDWAAENKEMEDPKK